MSVVSPDDYEDLGAAMEQKDAAPVVIAVNRILAKALSEGVAEIHIEPQPDALDVRFRKCGILQSAFSPLPAKVTASVISRFKALANLTSVPHKALQEGRIRRQFQGRCYDLLVTIVPGVPNERILLKVVDHSRVQPLDQLVMDPTALAAIKALVRQPQGLILVVGAPGAGKSTTLASMVLERQQPDTMIGTVENPIEYPFPGVIQIGWHPSKVGFAEALQGVLAQDPQVLLVNELSDRATMISALNAAQQCLVMAALPTDDLPATFSHLSSLGVEMSLVTQSLIGIIHPQLLRTVCPDCRHSHTFSGADIAQYGLVMSPDQTIEACSATVIVDPEAVKAAKTHGSLCSTCQGSGYSGQRALYEVLPLTDAMRALLIRGASPQDLYKAAVLQEGMTSLYSASLELFQQCLTTLEEVDRVTFSPELAALHRQQQEPSAVVTESGANEVNVLPLSEPLPEPLSEMTSEMATENEPSLPEPLAGVSTGVDDDPDALDLDRISLNEFNFQELANEQLLLSEGDSSMPGEPSDVSEVQPLLEDELPNFDPELSLDSFELSDEAEAELEQAEHSDLAILEPAASPALAEELAMVRKQLMETALARVELQRTLEQNAKELETAKQKVEQLEKDKTELKQQLVREREELTRKFDRQQVDLRRKAKKEVVIRVLDAIDSFEQANAQLSEEERDSSIHKGYRAIYRLLSDSMKKAGVTAVDAIGQPFNPEVHEAVMMEESSQHDCDTVVGELRRGYMMDDIILRPAQVKVAVAVEGDPIPPEPASPEPVATPEETIAEAQSTDSSSSDLTPVSDAELDAVDKVSASEDALADSLDAMLDAFSSSTEGNLAANELDQLLADLTPDG